MSSLSSNPRTPIRPTLRHTWRPPQIRLSSTLDVHPLPPPRPVLLVPVRVGAHVLAPRVHEEVRYGIYTCMAKVLGVFRGALGVIDGIYTCITGVRRCIKVRYGIYTCITGVYYAPILSSFTLPRSLHVVYLSNFHNGVVDDERRFKMHPSQLIKDSFICTRACVYPTGCCQGGPYRCRHCLLKTIGRCRAVLSRSLHQP